MIVRLHPAPATWRANRDAIGARPAVELAASRRAPAPVEQRSTAAPRERAGLAPMTPAAAPGPGLPAAKAARSAVIQPPGPARPSYCRGARDPPAALWSSP